MFWFKNTLPRDIKKYVKKYFPLERQDEIIGLLKNAKIHDGSYAGARLIRCALIASNGEIEALISQIKLMTIDLRDVIVAGEYIYKDDNYIQIIDLSKPFPKSLL